MALTKSAATLAQLTTTGNTAEADLSTAYAAVFSISHANGTGTISAAATIQPQVSHDGTNWFDDGGAFSAGTVASETNVFTYVPPTDGLPIAGVRFAYTAPTGSTGHALDVAYSKVTAL